MYRSPILKMASASSHTSASNSAIIQQLDTKSRDLIAKIVFQLKSQGNFDELRRDCLEELDKMEAFRQLNQRVESYVATFLSKHEWSESMSKNQIRDNLRKHVCASDALKSGAQRLVTQVLEKKSKSFQTRLEGVVQNFIYMENEKEKKSRYPNRSEAEKNCTKSFESKSECEKVSTSGKDTSSTILDINDIISQIPGPKENSSTSKSEGTANTRNDSRDSMLHQMTSTYHRTDSSLSKQATGCYSKIEQSKFEKKGDTSLSDAHKNTTSSKASVNAKKVSTSKRVVAKITGALNMGSSLEKTAEPSINSKTKPICNKPSHSPKVESPRDIQDVEKPNKPETVVTTLKPDGHKTSPASHFNKSSHSTGDKSKQSETDSGLHSRQKVDLEDKHVESTKLIQENIKSLNIESKGEENSSSDVQVKGELQERKIKDLTLSDKPWEEPLSIDTECSDTISSSNDHKDAATKENLTQDSESDIASDVSDVSSVHTSDLSSFDGEVSSDSNHSKGEVPEYDKKGSKEGTPDPERNLESKGKKPRSKVKKDSSKGKKSFGTCKTTKDSKMQQNETKQNSTTAAAPKRKRGRPRKEHSTSSDTMNEHGSLKQRTSRPHRVEESTDAMPVRDRSKRPIKKRRCYSPSSEGSREVCLPSKRSRVNSRD